MKRMHALFIILGIVCHFGVLTWISRHESGQRQEESAVNTARALSNAKTWINPRLFAQRIAQDLLQQCLDRVVDDPLVRNAVNEDLAAMPRGAMEIILTDADEAILWTSARSQARFQLFHNLLGARNFRKFGLKAPEDRRRRWRPLPHLICHWKTGTAAPGRIASVMVILDLRVLNERVRLSAEIRRWRRRGFLVGFWDTVQEKGLLPRGVSPALVKDWSENLGRDEDQVCLPDGSQAVFVPMERNLLLVGLTPKPPPVASMAWLGALFLWIPLALRLSLHAAGTVSLSTFFLLSLGIAAGLPLLLTLLFWSYFEQNRIDAVVGSHTAALEQHLIDLDNEFPRLLRHRRAQLRALHGELQKHRTNLRPALDRIAQAEFQALFSNCYLISSAGAQLRSYGNSDTGIRFFLPRPQTQRTAILQSFVDRGYELKPVETEVFLNTRLEPSQIDQIWRVMASEDERNEVLKAIGAICRVLLQRHNEATGNDAPDGKGNASNLVIGSMVDSQTGDLVQYAVSSLGSLMRFGGGEFDSRIFVDIVKDDRGAGEYCSFFFIDLRFLEHAFLDRIFSRQQAWPENVRFFAESSYSFVLFPLSLQKRLFQRWEQRLVPPRRFISEVTTIAGKKVIVAAFAARRLHHFLLVGVTPWKVVTGELSRLRFQAGILAGMMMVLLLVIVWRITTGILQPAWALVSGIEAMKRKDFDHRIPLTTGDEWDAIASAFNNTLAGMEELELAGLVQNRLLPSAPIRQGPCWFYGQSIMNQEVGGDYFDAHPCEDGSLAFVIGDVTGHGVSAALVTAMAKTAFQILLDQGIRSPGQMLTRMNALLGDHLKKQKLMTMSLGFVYPDGRVLYANAGHPALFVLSQEEGIQTVAQDSFPLGIRKKAVFPDITLQLHPKATLVLYTDGIIEAANPEGDFFGEHRLQALLLKLAALPRDQLIAAFQREFRTFTRTRPWEDDVTMAILTFDRGSDQTNP